MIDYADDQPVDSQSECNRLVGIPVHGPDRINSSWWKRNEPRQRPRPVHLSILADSFSAVVNDELLNMQHLDDEFGSLSGHRASSFLQGFFFKSDILIYLNVCCLYDAGKLFVDTFES